MKKISLLVLVCMIFSLCFTSCSVLLAKDNTPEHTHSYATEWSFDATNHYNACSCGSQSNVAKHADDNNDGACDVCAIILDNTHVFDDEWTTDATNHWHAALCGHDVVDAKAAHTADDLGNCTVCGVKVSSPTIADVAAAIELALAQDYAAKAGTVFYHHMQYDYEYDYSYPVDSFSYFDKSEGYLHVLNLAEATETWYYAVGDSVWSVFNDSGVISANPYEYGEDNLTGYYFDGAILGYSEVAQAYGVANLIDALYFLGEESLITLESEVTTVDGETVYTFSFGTPYYAGVYVVEVAFTLDQHSYYIDKAYVGVASVEEGNGVITEYETDENGDYVYDENGERIVKSITLDENVELDFSSYYELTQGEENKAPASPENDLVSSFEVKDSEGNSVGETINVSKGTPFVLSVVPNGGNIALDPIKAVVTDADGNETWSVFTNVDESGLVSINAYAEGTYILTVSTAKCTAVFNVVVTAPAVETIEVGVYDDSVWEYVAKTEISIYVNGTVDFKALVNDGANEGYTYSVTGNEDAYSVYEDWGCHIATFTAVGTYTITVTSVEDETKTASLAVTVAEKNIDYSSILTGTYVTVDSMVQITVVFNPTDATSGTAIASANHPMQGEISTTFNYTVEGNTFTATAAEGGSTFFQSLYVNDDEEVCVVADFWDYVLVPYTASGDGEAVRVDGSDSYMDNVPTLDNENVTYITTVDAYGMLYFQLQYDGTTKYQVTITHDGGDDVICYSGAPMMPTMVPSGGYITLDDINSNALIIFESMNEYDDIDVTFTLTFTEI